MEKLGDVSFLASIVDLDANSVKDLLYQMKQEHPNFVAVIGNKEGEKCGLSLMISESLVEANQWNAAQWIREVSTHIQGGGGGNPGFATAGGKNLAGIENALNKAMEI